MSAAVCRVSESPYALQDSGWNPAIIALDMSGWLHYGGSSGLCIKVLPVPECRFQQHRERPGERLAHAEVVRALIVDG